MKDFDRVALSNKGRGTRQAANVRGTLADASDDGGIALYGVDSLAVGKSEEEYSM